MKWLLIYWLIAGPTNFAATGNALFEDEKSCKAALQAVSDNWVGKLDGAPGVCVPQSTIETPAPAPRPSQPIQAVAPKAKP